MDEPTDGLDPNQKHEVRALIQRMGEEKAIIFSTHILEEVEAACARAIIISGGSVVANGTPEQLKQKAKGSGAIRLQIAGIPASAARADISALMSVDSFSVEKEEENVLRGLVHPQSGQTARASEEIFKYVAGKNGLLQELAVVEGRLDDVFREITTSDTEGAAAA